MANEMVTGGNGSQLDPFQQFGDEVATRQYVSGDMLLFSKMGKWQAGIDKDEIPAGTRMLAHVPGIRRGWRKWQDGKLVEHVTGLLADNFRVPKRHELDCTDKSEWGPGPSGQPIDPWQEVVYIVLLDEGGNFYTYVTASKTGISAVGELSAAYYKNKVLKGPSDPKLPGEIPVIELQARPWKHRDFGDMVAPKLKLTGRWLPIPDNFDELDQIGEDPSPEFMLPPPKAAAPEVKPATRPTAQKTSVKTKAPPAKGGKRPVKF